MCECTQDSLGETSAKPNFRITKYKHILYTHREMHGTAKRKQDMSLKLNILIHYSVVIYMRGILHHTRCWFLIAWLLFFCHCSHPLFCLCFTFTYVRGNDEFKRGKRQNSRLAKNIHQIRLNALYLPGKLQKPSKLKEIIFDLISLFLARYLSLVALQCQFKNRLHSILLLFIPKHTWKIFVYFFFHLLIWVIRSNFKRKWPKGSMLPSKRNAIHEITAF